MWWQCQQYEVLRRIGVLYEQQMSDVCTELLPKAYLHWVLKLLFHCPNMAVAVQITFSAVTSLSIILALILGNRFVDVPNSQ